MTGTPLSLTLSPKGRGNCDAPFVKGCSFINGLPTSRDAVAGAQFPLPLGERVRVRGSAPVTKRATCPA
jgi:hypothetical protein